MKIAEMVNLEKIGKFCMKKLWQPCIEYVYQNYTMEVYQI